MVPNVHAVMFGEGEFDSPRYPCIRASNIPNLKNCS